MFFAIEETLKEVDRKELKKSGKQFVAVLSFEEWKDAINTDLDPDTNEPFLKVLDMELGKHESSNGYVGDAVIFTVDDDLVDADIATLDEYFTQLMPQSIVDWLDENKLNFNYDIEDKNKIAFIVW